MSETKIRGLEVDLSKIQNPKLKRVILDRRVDFLFYREGTRHSDSHKQYGDHRDYTEYKERYDAYADEKGG